MNIEKIKEIEPLHQINRGVGDFFGRLIAFLKEYSVIGVAIGFIVASAAKDFVGAIVSGLFIPLLNLFIPGHDLAGFVFSIRGVRFDLGYIFSTLITLLLIVVLLYLIFKKIIKNEVWEVTEEKTESLDK